MERRKEKFAELIMRRIGYCSIHYQVEFLS